jgi:hypothetical protein
MITIGTISSSDKSVPNAPTIGTATNVGSGRAFNNGRSDVTFTAPAYTGRLPITGYTVTSNPGGFTGTGSASPITVTGLQSSTAYTFTVTGTNSVGTSAASAASNSITATTVPQAPTIGTATAGVQSATVTFTANATGGSAITGYTVTSSPGGFTGTGAASPISVTGLTAGTAYTFTTTATNANGTSAASAASNSITALAPTDFESIASFTPTGTNTVTFSSIPQTYKHLQLRINAFSQTAQPIRIRFNGDTGSNYWWDYFGTTGSGISTSGAASVATSIFSGLLQYQDSTFPGVGIIDIIDYASTSKAKVTKHIMSHERGGAGSGFAMSDGVWTSNSAITSITVLCDGSSSNYTTGTVISLYGIKG